jgi:hypothetical protein
MTSRSMTVSVMQPYFFPYIGYFQLIANADIFVFHDDVQYIKRGWVNRNKIVARTGEPFWITLPVTAASHILNINQRSYILQPDATAILRRVEQSYGKAANFAEAGPIVEAALKHDEPNVAEFNIAAVQSVLRAFGVERPILRSSQIDRTPGLKGQDRIIDICRRLGATRYVNPIGGVDLYDARAFAAHGIELGFLSTTASPYVEAFPYLSIIHTLMTAPIADRAELLRRYQIIAPRPAEDHVAT